MHDLKQIREDLENFKKSLNHRNSEIDFDQILDLDKKNRQLIQEKAVSYTHLTLPTNREV